MNTEEIIKRITQNIYTIQIMKMRTIKTGKKFVGNKLVDLGFDVEDTFSSYLHEDE